MSYNNTLKIANVKEAIFKWIAYLKFVPNQNIVYEEQNKQRPVGNYISYKIITLPAKRGFDSQAHVSGDTFKLTGHRTMSLSVKTYGVDAPQMAIDLHSSLELESVRNIFKQYNFCVWGYGTPRDISALLETGFESRGVIDIMLAANAEMTETLGYIDSANTEGTLTDVDGSIIVSTQLIEPN